MPFKRHYTLNLTNAELVKCPFWHTWQICKKLWQSDSNINLNRFSFLDLVFLFFAFVPQGFSVMNPGINNQPEINKYASLWLKLKSK